jgi:hypothetical protein
MPPLASELRNKLERVVVEARDAAEAGARAALESLAVHHYEPYPHMKPAQRGLRNHLRARARQLGDRQDSTGRLAVDHLANECAYEHWHRMLFARFLAENGLLIEPQENMAISLAEAEELAKEEGVDVWVFASRCAQRMLPQIFRPDDPLLQVSFATEHMLKLEGLLASLPQAVFTASDALGWVYQFWQSKKKDEVNRSEVKIGADELPAVTQLFTEPYMAHFLLHNTLGAWHAGKVLPALSAEALAKADEASLRKACALPGVGWEYLRFVREDGGRESCEAGQSDSDEPAKHGWRPAAGTFDGWPKTAAELKVLDPCCGSGHFLVAALHHLVPIRMAEEGLSGREAVDAVLRDNLYGLEIDERCCQIAAFALAFAAWTYPKAGGYRPLPDLHIACTGIAPQATKAQWLELAERAAAKGHMPGKRDLFRKEESLLSSGLANALESLYDLFAQAPTLGSLIDPRRLPRDLYQAGYEALAPLLAEVFKAEVDDETRERAIAAAGMVKAADLLAGEYTLVITNVPYLGFKKQSAVLREVGETRLIAGKANLATMFIERCLPLLSPKGVMALVAPQNWLLQGSYEPLRRHTLQETVWWIFARLGPGAFESISGEVVDVCLLGIGHEPPTRAHHIFGLDATGSPTPHQKSTYLRNGEVLLRSQQEMLQNPDARVVLDSVRGRNLLADTAVSPRGIVNGDNEMWTRYVWEVPPADRWRTLQDAVLGHELYGGRSRVIDWSTSGRGMLRPGLGNVAYRRHGVAVSRMGDLPCTLYTGELYDQNTAVIVPAMPRDVPALWAYCTSGLFLERVRQIDHNLNVTPATLLKVPFDLEEWEGTVVEQYPDGLPEPESDDPTQWLFHGRPEESTAPLQVAVARLLGYRWPTELDDKIRLSKRARALVKRCDELLKFADDDGIVCIPSVRGEEPAAERLLALLAAAGVKPAQVRALAGGADLDDWLRNGFFEEHCKLFHDRPFVWHIWDGRKRDGFHALVNYHKLCESGGRGRKLLESLTYAYLGEWITRQKDGVKRGEEGAEDRLAAALELQKRLEAILEGEPPFDLFVRWKPLADQPVGWEPDINDGVRVNIRPFLASDLPAGRTGAGVLRWKPNIKWTKDRGKEPERSKAEYPWFWNWDEKTEDFMGKGSKPDGNRWNNCHYTNKVRQQARGVAGKGGG